MNRARSAAARRERERDLALLRDAVVGDGTVEGAERRIRRLVHRGLAENLQPAHGAARGATATITGAGRRRVAEAAS